MDWLKSSFLTMYWILDGCALLYHWGQWGLKRCNWSIFLGAMEKRFWAVHRRAYIHDAQIPWSTLWEDGRQNCVWKRAVCQGVRPFEHLFICGCSLLIRPALDPSGTNFGCCPTCLLFISSIQQVKEQNSSIPCTCIPSEYTSMADGQLLSDKYIT